MGRDNGHHIDIVLWLFMFASHAYNAKLYDVLYRCIMSTVQQTPFAHRPDGYLLSRHIKHHFSSFFLSPSPFPPFRSLFHA